MLTYNDSTSYKTFMGGSCSTLILISVIILTVLQIMRLLGKGEITVNYSQTPINRQEFDKDDHEIFVEGKQIGILFPTLGSNVNLTRIFDISAELLIYEIDPLTRRNESSNEPIELEQCDDSVFADFTLSNTANLFSY